MWQRALDGTGHWLRDPAGLASRDRVGPGVIHRAIAAAAGHDPMTPCDDRIDAFLRQRRDLRLAGHARRVDRLANWSDLVLPPDIMDSLRELVGRVRHRRTVFEDWGMGRTMATSRGLTALFQGQPGTGKTLVADVIARELGLDLYQVDLSKVMSKWIGETERNLATIFDAAEDGQVILLFDEADSLFAKRTEVRSSNDRYANLEVNYLLQRLDSFEGIAILTTNSGGSIDPAFKRRLSFRLSFPFPDEDTRAERLVQRKARDANGVADGADHAVSAASSSTGSPLPDPLMRKFESSLGADLSGVRIHTGETSERAAEAVGAKAYTMGNDIHFGAGHYDPSSSGGQYLLAHEVAHTVQQSGGAQRMQFKLEVSSPGDSLEHEADRAANAMVSDETAVISSTSGGSHCALQRDRNSTSAHQADLASSIEALNKWELADIRAINRFRN